MILILGRFQLFSQDLENLKKSYYKKDYESYRIGFLEELKNGYSSEIPIPFWRNYFLLEPSLDLFEQQLELYRISRRPICNFLKIGIEKAFISRNLDLGNQWGSAYFQDCKMTKTAHKTLYYYSCILFLSQNKIDFGKVTDWLLLQNLKPELKNKIETLIRANE